MSEGCWIKRFECFYQNKKNKPKTNKTKKKNQKIEKKTWAEND